MFITKEIIYFGTSSCSSSSGSSPSMLFLAFSYVLAVIYEQMHLAYLLLHHSLDHQIYYGWHFLYDYLQCMSWYSKTGKHMSLPNLLVDQLVLAHQAGHCCHLNTSQ
jgi:hypothetical protein